MGRKSKTRVSVLNAAVSVLAIFGGPAPGADRGSTAPPPRVEALPRRPLAFVENCGQWHPRARFEARGAGVATRVEEGAISLLFRELATPKEPVKEGAALRLVFERSQSTALIEGREELGGSYNFFLGRDPSRWRSRLPGYARVSYRGLYPGIDLEVRESGAEGRGGRRGGIEYDLLLEPGAELAQVSVRCDGAEGLELAGDGALVLETRRGPVRQAPPVAWQVGFDGGRVPLACRYRLLDGQRFGFEAPGLDPRLSAVIDPLLEWGLFIGGGSDDWPWDLALDPDGGIIIAGGETSVDFPVTDNEHQKAPPGTLDAFVSRVDPGTGDLVYSTLLGGSLDEEVVAVKVAGDGSVVIAGYTSSSEFPVTDDSEPKGDRDAFVLRLDRFGEKLLASTLLGGEREDVANCLDLLKTGEAVVGGFTASPEFPVTGGAFQESYGGGAYDAFLAKVRLEQGLSREDALSYSTFLGGTGDEALPGTNRQQLYSRLFSHALVVDEEGKVIFTGETNAGFPTTPGAFGNTLHGRADVYVVRLDPDSSLGPDNQLLYSAILGGSADDVPDFMVLDRRGGVWISCVVYSPDFPTTKGAYSRMNPDASSKYSAVYLNIIPDLNLAPEDQLRYSTYLGGTEIDDDGAMAVGADGVLTLLGDTLSSDFPTTPGAFSGTNSGQMDLYLARLNPDPTLPPASQLEYSTYLGGDGIEVLYAMAVDSRGRLVAAISSNSAGVSPIPGETTSGGSDAAVIVFDFRPPRADFEASILEGVRVEVDASRSLTPPGTSITSYEWDWGAGALTSGPKSSFTFPGPGRFPVTLEVTNDLDLTAARVKALTVPSPRGDTAPWLQADAGESAPAFPGAASRDGQDLLACAGGRDIAGKSDQFFFLYQEFEGDGVLTARVRESHGGEKGAKVCLMLRESLQPGARHGAMAITKGTADLFRFLQRTAADGTSGSNSVTARANGAEDWIRLERKGDELFRLPHRAAARSPPADGPTRPRQRRLAAARPRPRAFQPRPSPAQFRPSPARPRPSPARLRPSPARRRRAPARRRPSPARRRHALARRPPFPARPRHAYVRPRPVPARPRPVRSPL